MKPIKMFGLATLAALMAMAFVGASSAMATGSTALCASEQATCSSPVTHVHETSVGKGKLEPENFPTIECNVLFLGDALNSGLGNPLIIHGAFTYSSCNNFCSVKEETGPAELKILKTGSELASVTHAWWLIHATCPFINCYIDGILLEGHGLGPLTSSSPNGSIVLTKQEVFNSKGMCIIPTYLTLTTTPLSATYISA